MEHLSDIELYYSPIEFIKYDTITLEGEEFHHSAKVMRNTNGDLIYITDGEGKIYNCKITRIDKRSLDALIMDEFKFDNTKSSIWFCIPILKNPDRLKFAFEKCVELGITNFLLFSSKYSITKKIDPDKFQKTTLAAMKQSLRAYLPQIIVSTFAEIVEKPGQKILFNQNSKNNFEGNIKTEKTVYFLFGPEGGFDKSEMELISPEHHYSLSTNRLRSETAIMKCASILK